MFALELSMKKGIKKNWVAGFSVIPAIIAFGFSVRPNFGIGIRYRPKPKVSVSEPKFFLPKPKLFFFFKNFQKIFKNFNVFLLPRGM